MKKLIYLILIIISISCTKTRIDMDNNKILGTWNDDNMTFYFQKDSFRTCNQLGLFHGVYYIAENTILCKTQYNTYLYVELHETNWSNKTLFVYWFNYTDKRKDLLEKK